MDTRCSKLQQELEQVGLLLYPVSCAPLVPQLRSMSDAGAGIHGRALSQPGGFAGMPIASCIALRATLRSQARVHDLESELARWGGRGLGSALCSSLGGVHRYQQDQTSGLMSLRGMSMLGDAERNRDKVRACEGSIPYTESG